MRTASKVQSKSSTSGDKVTFSSMAAVKPPSAPETFTSPDGSKLSDEEIAQEEEQIEEAVATEAAREDPSLLRAFVMTLQQTDVGSGQTTPGTSRRSPEIFIPLSARDYSPEFWGWPDEFEKDAAKEDKFDRRDVQFKLDTQIVSVNMMTWPDKHDFRLRAEALRSAGVVDDIIKIEKAPDDALYEYVVTVIPKGSVDYDSYLKRCTASVRNSRKQYGYF